MNPSELSDAQIEEAQQRFEEANAQEAIQKQIQS